MRVAVTLPAGVLDGLLRAAKEDGITPEDALSFGVAVFGMLDDAERSEFVAETDDVETFVAHVEDIQGDHGGYPPAVVLRAAAAIVAATVGRQDVRRALAERVRREAKEDLK